MNSTVATFLRLFRGRGDAYGTWHGTAVRERVTPEMFRRHLTSTRPDDWFGIYNVIGDRCSWGCVDIDIKDLPLASNIRLSLQRQGIPAWIEATTRGYHVWVFPADALVDADTMRRALHAACHAIGYQPKEIFPKQTRVAGCGLGNYVRLPLNGALAAPRLRTTRRFCGNPALRTMDRQRAATADLEHVAAQLPRPQHVDIIVDVEAGVEFEETIQQVGGVAYRLWRDGPRSGRDRSNTLYQLAHRLREADVDPATALAVVGSADQRWGKRFADRGPQGEDILRNIVTRTYAS
jgi:hypothetical protein